MQIFSVVGARPQFIKAAPLSAALRERHSEFLVHTGQHYDDAMSEVFFRQLRIPPPDANLGVGSGGHAEQTASMLVQLEKLMLQRQPDWVLVYGDTNSTLAAALAAAKLHLPVAHVEAGLRSYNRAMPEEINRVLTDHISQLLLCPTQAAVDNLAQEGITRGVVLSGDIMVDSVRLYSATAREESRIHAQLGLNPTAYIAATIHRPANTDQAAALTEIVAALDNAPLPVIFPVHPRARKMLAQFGLTPAKNLRLIDPLGYLDMLALVDGAAVLVTDSGGLQKEAYIQQTPCVTIRRETEWVETVASGWNRLVEAQQDAILSAIEMARGQHPTTHPPFYGDGQTAARIVAALEG